METEDGKRRGGKSFTFCKQTNKKLGNITTVAKHFESFQRKVGKGAHGGPSPPKVHLPAG